MVYTYFSYLTTASWGICILLGRHFRKLKKIIKHIRNIQIFSYVSKSKKLNVMNQYKSILLQSIENVIAIKSKEEDGRMCMQLCTRRNNS